MAGVSQTGWVVWRKAGMIEIASMGEEERLAGLEVDRGCPGGNHRPALTKPGTGYSWLSLSRSVRPVPLRDTRDLEGYARPYVGSLG